MNLVYKIVVGIVGLMTQFLVGYFVYRFITKEIAFRKKISDGLSGVDRRKFFKERNFRLVLIGLPFFIAGSFVFVVLVRITLIALEPFTR